MTSSRKAIVRQAAYEWGHAWRVEYPWGMTTRIAYYATFEAAVHLAHLRASTWMGLAP